MTSNLIFSSLKRLLERYLALNSQSEFMKTLESIKKLDAKHEELSGCLTQAYSKWNMIDEYFVSYYISKSSQGAIKDLESLTSILRYISLIDYPYVTEVIKPIESVIKKLNPFEISPIQTILLIQGLEQSRYQSDTILEFITLSIMSSNLPSGRLNQGIISQLLKWFSNTNILDSDLWNLIQQVLETERVSQFSFENLISVLQSLSIIDTYTIPNSIMKSFEQIHFHKLPENLKFQSIQVKNYLSVFKKREISCQSLDSVSKELNLKHLNSFYSPITSKFQQEVQSALESCKIAFKSEQMILNNNSFVSVDILLDDETVIEVQGPFHYLHPKMSELRKTVKKREYLNYFGFKVKSIPYYEWPSSDQDQIRYVSKLLSK